MPRPGTMDDAQAAGLPLAALTAWQALFGAADLQAGQTLLILATAGGVGHLAVQLAKWKGAHVTGTASARNEPFLRELGIDRVIDYNRTRFEDVARDVDVVLDGVGGESQERSWSVLKPGGMLASIRGRPDAEQAAARGVRARYISVRNDAAQLRAIADLAARGLLNVHVDETFPLKEVRKCPREEQDGSYQVHGRPAGRLGRPAHRAGLELALTSVAARFGSGAPDGMKGRERHGDEESSIWPS